jgi:flagellar hook-associated protein 1 FlgK
MTISGLFEIGKRSLLAYQSAINTTSQNIANVGNENYSRRRVEIAGLSNGMPIEDAIRLRQRFAEQQYWQESQQLGRYDTLGSMLGQIENVFAEDTEAGLSNVLNQFWNAWNDLANNPESESSRTIVKDKAIVLTDRMRNMYSDLNDLQQQVLPQIGTQISDINQKLTELGRINNQLRSGQTSDLMDQRDKLVGELSEYLSLKVKEKATGEVTLYSEGLALVSEGHVNQLETTVVQENGHNKVQIRVKDMEKALSVSSGSLSAYVDIHNEYIPEYLDRLDTMARQLVESVNEIHITGENLSGTTGIDFFTSGITSAADFTVNQSIIDDPNLIATRLPGEGDGSGSIAQSVSNLRFQSITSEGTIANYYQSMLSGLGNGIQANEFLSDSQSLIVQQLQNQRDAVAGVSLDEEMTRMMQYEQAFQAAARIVTTVDEMMQTVLDMR